MAVSQEGTRVGRVCLVGSLPIMQLGIDLGTTRTLVAAADRGNFPVVSFLDSAGDSIEHIPSAVALSGSRLVYGFEALAAHDDGAPIVRSFKRQLADPGVTMDSRLQVGDLQVPLVDVLTGFLAHVRQQIVRDSTISRHLSRNQSLDVAVAVPAHAHSAQRFLTLEAFGRAGFDVRAMINEPSAAGFEYTHRQGHTLSSRRTKVIVYDLGGGTWDSSLVRVDDKAHEVLDSLGINRLGGDDFDELLALEALGIARVPRDNLTDDQWAQLLEECRIAKERLAPQTRRIVVDVMDEPTVVPVDRFFEAVAPLVERTIEAMGPLVGGLDDFADFAEVAGIYLVGGGSSLPIVARMLRSKFGRRVHRSPYPAASTAIGLAISQDPDAGYSLADRLSRGLGVYREAHGGSQLAFDALVDRDLQVSLDSDVVVTRRYRAAHNVGWFRFVEYSMLDETGQPRGDLAPFAEVVFPFDSALQNSEDLRGIPVERRQHGPEIEERYRIDRHGIMHLEIRDLDTGFETRRSLTLPAT